MSAIIATGRQGAWILFVGLALGLLGCQPQAYKEPTLPPPTAAAPQPRPQPVRPTLYVAIGELNLRTCPGVDCRRISTLELNTEVEKMGEIEHWTQVRVKKDGTIGYVSSRYLSPKPVQVAQTTRRRPKKTKLRKAAEPAETAREAEEAGPKKQEPTTPLPRVM